METTVPEQAAASLQDEQPARILIVDDDATMRLLMRETLQDEGYRIDETDNGVDALQIIRAEPPALVLLDVRMPGMSGFEVCSEIRRFSGDTHIAVVMVTGLEDSKSIEQAFDLGATAFISKPINWVTFPHRIQYILKARSAFVELQQREMHLRHLDRISRIVMQNRHIDSILPQVLMAMLDIFNCDRALLLSRNEADGDEVSIKHEVTREGTASIKSNPDGLLEAMEANILYRADTSEYPIISQCPPAQASASRLHVHQQILHALQCQQTEHWYLIIQQCQQGKPWNRTDYETFYRACLRLGSMLSSHLLMEKLHASEQLLQQAQRIGKLGNWHWEAQTGKLTWSDEMYRILGYECGSFIPDYRVAYRLFSDEDRNRLLQQRQGAAQHGDAYSMEYRIRLPDDSLRWVHEHGIGVRDASGAISSINGTLQDITDRRKKQEQEIHEQKMDAIGQLTSGVAHDFGNLMTVARGNLELLADILHDKHELSQDAREMLEDASSAIADGIELTRQLLAFSRKKSIAPEYINIAQQLDSFSKLLKHTLSDNIRLSVHVDDDLPDILVDPIQLETSLLNLCINARNAMPNGGDLHIHAGHCTRPVMHNNDDEQSSQGCVEIRIRDTGIGMDKELVERAVEPFFTTNKQEGTGLGLSMVYGFMRQSKGELVIDSTPGEGTTMSLHFPVLGGSAEHHKDETGSTPELIGHATILIAEDRDSVRQFAVRCLNTLDVRLLLARDAGEAQQLLDRHDDIDLLFTDIVMPGDINGRELAAWTRQHHPGVKILLTTASEKQLHYQAAADEITHPLIPKPYSKQELIQAIHAVLAD